MSTLRDEIADIIERDTELDVWHGDPHVDDPRPAVDNILSLIRDRLLSNESVEAGARSVWDSSPGDWPYDRAQGDGSAFLANRIKQQQNLSRIALTAALDAITKDTTDE